MRRCRPLLGTFVEIEGEDTEEEAFAAAFAALELVQKLMSFHDPGSELSKLNRFASSGPVSVHPWTEKLLRWARRIHKETDGLFDCAIGDRLSEWKLFAFSGVGRARTWYVGNGSASS